MTTGNMIGLSVTALVFIAFAVWASLVAPKRWPDFPGQHGLPVFIVASVVLFGAMVTAVELFGIEEHEAHAAHPVGGGEVHKTITVQEKEYKIVLPALKVLAPGNYTFDVKNVGRQPHDLVIEGGDLANPASTKVLQPGEEATLEVALSQGEYTLYCSVDGHRELGMLAKLAVG